MYILEYCIIIQPISQIETKTQLMLAYGEKSVILCLYIPTTGQLLTSKATNLTITKDTLT